jgi:hypothetical protein
LWLERIEHLCWCCEGALIGEPCELWLGLQRFIIMSAMTPGAESKTICTDGGGRVIMPEAAMVWVRDFCPACGFEHAIPVQRDVVQQVLDPGRDVQLRCLRTGVMWNMSENARQNTRKALADGVL